MSAILESAFRLAAPILLAALGGTFSLLAGDLNIGLEGLMILSAFVAVAADYWFQSWAMGLAAGVLTAALAGGLFSWAAIRRWGNPFVLGILLNILAAAAASIALQELFGVKGSFSSPEIMPLPASAAPAWLGGIPVIGSFLNHQPLTVYLTAVLAVGAVLLLYRIPLGLWIRAVGEYPLALQGAGVSPERVRLLAGVLGGALCGLAGVHLSLGHLQMFSEGMTAGRGFVALAAAIFARGRIGLLVVLAVIFGAAESLSIRLQQSSIPAHFPLMIPYLATLILLLVTVGRQRRREGSLS